MQRNEFKVVGDTSPRLDSRDASALQPWSEKTDEEVSTGFVYKDN